MLEDMVVKRIMPEMKYGIYAEVGWFSEKIRRIFLSFNRMDIFIGMCFLTDVNQVSDCIMFCFS